MKYAIVTGGARGLGLGIDRLLMMLTGTTIRQTVLFPFVRPTDPRAQARHHRRSPPSDAGSPDGRYSSEQLIRTQSPAQPPGMPAARNRPGALAAAGGDRPPPHESVRQSGQLMRFYFESR